MRKRIYEVIEVAEIDDIWSRLYDVIMMVSIVLSILPMAFKEDYLVFFIIDKITVAIFIIDYLARLATADFKLGRGALSFVQYPFTPLAIIDLLAILPSITAIDNAMRAFRVFRLFRTLRVFRLFKAFRYSKYIQLVANVFRKQKQSLVVVCVLAAGYIFFSAIIVFNVEPETFGNFFDALYWATVSLTTVGYGDIYTVSATGKLITMLSALFGIAIVALPSGILTAGYIDEVKLFREAEEKRKEAKEHEEETKKETHAIRYHNRFTLKK